jgi:hypothetical protein
VLGEHLDDIEHAPGRFDAIGLREIVQFARSRRRSLPRRLTCSAAAL